MNLVALQFETSRNFENNLDTLIKLIKNCDEQSFILAPELCLSGFYYDLLDKAYEISLKAIDILKELSTNKIISLTLVNKKDNKYYNTLYIFYKNKIVHSQAKVKLFLLDNENRNFTSGNEQDIKIIDIDGIKVASLICFELRFVQYWKTIQGADIILLPAMWGKSRKLHYESLSTSLAIMNQCYVIASNSSNDDMAKSSGIISPFGIQNRDDTRELISLEFDKKEIKKMRRYLETGIK